ncbi:unnamed protein product, partial [marine sediment metagenome]
STLSKLTTYSAAKRLRSQNMGESGFDELEAGEHITDGSDVSADTWGVTEDLHDNSGAPMVLITDDHESLEDSMTSGEIFGALQVLTPLRNRDFSAGCNWTNHNLSKWGLTGEHFWSYAAVIGTYWKLDPQYAPMTHGHTYKMTLYNTGSIFNGWWEFQDYDGNELTIVADSPMGVLNDPFQVKVRPLASSNNEYWFTPDSETTTGGFRVVGMATYANGQYWDDFTLVDAASPAALVVGTVFKVLGTGDTDDNKLYTAKSDVAPAAGDLFAITG